VFGIGGGEWLLVGVVALFVFGPEKLPTMARQAGAWLRDARRVVNAARRDLDRELGLDEAPFSAADLRKVDPRRFDPRRLNPRQAVLDSLLEDDPPPRNDAARKPAGSGPAPRPDVLGPPMPPRTGRTVFDAEAT
jgi:sec-independent protein translocase protein TatB